jgi:hypothetical protein
MWDVSDVSEGTVSDDLSYAAPNELAQRRRCYYVLRWHRVPESVSAVILHAHLPESQFPYRYLGARFHSRELQCRQCTGQCFQL